MTDPVHPDQPHADQTLPVGEPDVTDPVEPPVRDVDPPLGDREHPEHPEHPHGKTKREKGPRGRSGKPAKDKDDPDVPEVP